MEKYHTKQRQALLEFLSSHTDEELSAGVIASALAPEGISRSAVYRNLSALEAEGKVRRSVKAGSREAYYEYSAGCGHCLHLSCRVCGKTTHMKGAGADALTRCIERTDGFTLDREQTVIYGLCAKCKKEARA